MSEVTIYLAIYALGIIYAIYFAGRAMDVARRANRRLDVAEERLGRVHGQLSELLTPVPVPASYRDPGDPGKPVPQVKDPRIATCQKCIKCGGARTFFVVGYNEKDDSLDVVCGRGSTHMGGCGAKWKELPVTHYVG